MGQPELRGHAIYLAAVAGVLVTFGGVALGLGAAESSGTTHPVLSDPWSQAGIVIAVAGLVLLAIGAVLYFARPGKPTPSTREAALADLEQAHVAQTDDQGAVPADRAAAKPGPAGSPAPATPAVAASAPPTPDAAWPPTVTAAAGHDRPGSASPADRQAADALQPMPAAGAHEEPDALALPAAAVSPAASGPGRPAAEIASRAQPAAAAARAAGTRRRRRRALFMIAVVALLGVIAGLIIAAPWTSAPPVLPPIGLTVGSATASSVAFRWSGPATGPAPDRYEILRDGQLAGSVLGTITSYQASGLAPGTSYQFQVIAIRGGQRSPQSSVLDIRTLTPPVYAALLDGLWIAHYQTLSVNPPDRNSSIGKPGTTWADSWTFTPKCETGPCDVAVTGEFDGVPFTASLARAGAVYTGTTALDNFAYCYHPRNRVRSTLHIQVQVRGADVQGSVWTASSWAGTVILDLASAYFPTVGNCSAFTFEISVAGGS